YAGRRIAQAMYRTARSRERGRYDRAAPFRIRLDLVWRKRLRLDRNLCLDALELAFVDVPLLRRPELAAGELALVDRVVEFAGCDAVTDPAHVGELALECTVQRVVGGRAGRQHDRV